MSIFCIFHLFSTGSNCVCWRAVPWFWLQKTILTCVHVLSVCIFTPQDTYSPSSQDQRCILMLPLHVSDPQGYRIGFICCYSPNTRTPVKQVLRSAAGEERQPGGGILRTQITRHFLFLEVISSSHQLPVDLTGTITSGVKH